MSDGLHDGGPQRSSSPQSSAGKRACSEDGVSSCDMFKKQLQEYAQKAGVPAPVYETTEEGPSDEPVFRSTVIVNEVRYGALLGFMNREAAEQSAAELALMELAKSGQVDCSISQPVHETGLCKSLLQEYAQKMGYAVPLYQHEECETENCGRGYQCSIEIGGTKYIGAVATSKEEAELKAASAAWLAIEESSTELSGKSPENSLLTVLLSRKRVLEAPSLPEETTNTTPLAKEARLEDMDAGVSTPDSSDEATLVSEGMNDVGMKKKDRGLCWVTVRNKLHAFQPKDTSHERNSDIQKMLAKLKEDIEAVGYIPDTSCAPLDLEGEEEKSAQVWHHSEKIALAFGLISIPPGLPIKMMTNPMVCRDCHHAFKCVSTIVRREIHVRDCVKLHKFWGGQCSCNDKW